MSGDARLDEALRASGLRSSRISSADFEEYARASRAPAVIVLDIRGQNQVPPSLAAFRRQHSGSAVVLVVAALDPRLMLDAMRAGVAECLHEPLTSQALEEAVRRVLVDRVPISTGQVMAFVGAKGGVGTTTIAVNTAATVARKGDDVLLVDLHVGHGDAAVLLGVEPRFSIVDALDNLHRVDDAFFKGLVEKTKAGVDLLGASDRLLHAALDTKRLRTLLAYASHKYRFTILDVPRSDLAMLDVLESASAIAIVATQELSALRQAGRLAHALRTRYSGARVTAIVNRFDTHAEIGHDDVERVIGAPVKHLVPSDYRVAIAALNAGRPFVLEPGRLAHAVKAVANELAGIVPETQARPAGMLSRLAFRRA
jgi:pilus assembly protein CpaE